MKILIVDDNVAVQEIIKDILAEEGHDAHVASSVDEAVLKIGSFDPDIVMLDTWVGDEDGLRVINRCRENREDRPLNVILIKSLGEQVPKDNPFIRGYIDKPFKSTDVLTVLKNVIDIIRTEEEQNSGKKGKKKKKRSSFSLFRKKPTKVQTCNTDISEEGLVHGTSYVIFEKDPKDIYTFVGLFNPEQYSILMVSSDRVKAVKERFESSKINVVSFSHSQKAGSMDIQGLGSLMVYINDFVKGHYRPVVVFDNFGDMVERDGLNNVLVMFHQMVIGTTDDVTFAVSVDPSILTDKDRNILLHDMKQYKI